MKYTIYVFKDTVKQLKDAMAAESLHGDYPYIEVAVKGVDFPVAAYFQRDKFTEPSWLCLPWQSRTEYSRGGVSRS